MTVAFKTGEIVKQLRQKDKCFMTSLVESKSNRLLETERRMVIARGGGIGDIGKCWLNSTDSS